MCIFTACSSQTLSGDPQCPPALCASACSEAPGGSSLGSFESRDAVIVGAAAAAPHTPAATCWVFCNGERLRTRTIGSHSDKTTCRLLLSAIEALLAAPDCATAGLAVSAAEACALRCVSLPEDAAFTYHDPPAAGDVIYN